MLSSLLNRILLAVGVGAAIAIVVLWHLLTGAWSDLATAKRDLKSAQQQVTTLEGRTDTNNKVRAMPQTEQRKALDQWATD